jgi:hypothetical protein
MRLSTRAAVNLWGVGFVGAAVIQGLFPSAFARTTSWGYNGGWQREIAIWNVGTLATLATLRHDGTDRERGLIEGFALLSALLGANHLAAALRSPRSVGNWVGAASNGVGFGFGIAALVGDRDGRPYGRVAAASHLSAGR